MQKSVPHGSKGSFGFQDVLYVLFKHKWKILIMSALGFAAAATVFVTRKPLYQSQAKIAIKYVLQRGGMDSHESEVEASGRGGDQVVNTELEILRSGDLAKEVAEAIGPDRLLPTVGEAANLNAAAGVVLGGLEVMPASRGSNVVYVTYRNEDPQLAVDVLQEVVKRYFNKHLEIHRSVGAFDSVAQQVDEVRNRLRQTEDELNKLKSNAGIISVNDESMSLALQRDKTKQDLVNAEAERDAQATRVQALERDLATAGQSDATAVASVSAKPILKAEKPVPAPPKPEEVEEYRELATQMERLQQQGFELRNKFAAGNAQVIRNQQEVASLKAKRTAMLAKTPGLAMEAATAASGNEAPNPLLELRKERDVLVAIEARIERYHTHLTELETRIKMLSDVQPQITDLERRKEMEDGEYRLLETNLKKARVDRTLDPSQIPNIPVLQQPSAPQRTFSELSTKIALGLAGAGVLSGLGLAFLLELVIDRRIKRPNEIESRLQLPLMLSIPYVRPKNRGALLIANDRSESGGEGDKPNLPAVRGTHGFHPFPAKTDHFIHPYSEAIRDRIVFNFQVNNMTHKPKLMAVAGLSAGAGTSTIAAGLAKAFSEVNGAKVLLVDLNS
jgi:succinoglycan biosynthesis transport protein ExoP